MGVTNNLLTGMILQVWVGGEPVSQKSWGVVPHLPRKWTKKSILQQVFFLKGIRDAFQPSSSSWWLNQPIRKICSSISIISPGRGENKKYLKPPPSHLLRVQSTLWIGAPAKEFLPPAVGYPTIVSEWNGVTLLWGPYKWPEINVFFSGWNTLLIGILSPLFASMFQHETSLQLWL